MGADDAGETGVGELGCGNAGGGVGTRGDCAKPLLAVSKHEAPHSKRWMNWVDENFMMDFI